MFLSRSVSRNVFCDSHRRRAISTQSHRHVNGNDVRDYSDRWHINIFTRAVYCDGKYKKGAHVPGFV